MVWFTFLAMFWQLKNQLCKNKGKNIQGSIFADIYFYEFTSFIFKVPLEKVVIGEEEVLDEEEVLHGIEIDGFVNLLENL